MAEFVGGKSVVVDVGEPITFENKTDADFNVSYGVVFRKSGLYRVSVNGKHTSITIEPERKTGKWIKKPEFCGDDVSGFIDNHFSCSECKKEAEINACGFYILSEFCPHCGARMEGEEDR